MRSPDVDAWFAGYENPQKQVALDLREVILDSNARIEESIKWKSPTFLQGQHRQLQPALEAARRPHVPHGGEHPRGVPRPGGHREVTRYLKGRRPRGGADEFSQSSSPSSRRGAT